MENKKIEKKIWTILTIVWIAQALMQVLSFGYGSMLQDIIADFGLDYTKSGLIGSIASWVAVVITIPLAFVGNKFGGKVGVAIMIILTAIGTWVFGTATTQSGLYIGKVVSGVFASGITTSLVLVKSKHVPQERLGDVNGVENFVQPVGQTVATLFIVQILAALGGWRTLYKVVGIALVIVAIVWLILFKQEKEEKPAEQPVEEKGAMLNALKAALKEKTFWLLALGWPGTTIIWIGIFFFWPSYATQTLGFTAAQAGLAVSFIPIFSAVASLTAPRLANKIGKYKPLIWPWGIILPICYFAMLKSTSLVACCVCAAIAGYGAYCFVPLAFTTCFMLGLDQKVVAFGTAMVVTGINLGAALGGTLVGAVITAFNGDIYKALAVCCLSPLLFGILTFFLPERGRKYWESLKK